MKVYYLPIESYQERYTEYLRGWTEAALKRRGIDFMVVSGITPEFSAAATSGKMEVGLVLDARGRSFWSLTQMAELVKHLAEMSAQDVVYLDDMFTPGYEILPYFFSQVPKNRWPRIFARNHAQSIDPDDFTFPMRHWMRRYEQMVMETCDGIFISADVHREMMQAALLDQVPIYNVGHPFDGEGVRRVVGKDLVSLSDRESIVLYSSRFDKEKQPHFFMDLVQQVKQRWPELRFIVCTGSKQLRSNDPTAVPRARVLAQEGLIEIVEGATKKEYYTILAASRAQLNTAKQDFVSYTAIEASALGTPTLAPAFRSFPEAMENRGQQLFSPWSLDEAVDKLLKLVSEGMDAKLIGRLAEHHDKSLDRIVDVFEGKNAT